MLQRLVCWIAVVFALLLAPARAEPVLRVGVLADFAPYQLWPSGGSPGGADLELLDAAARRLGWTLLPVRYERFDELLADLRAGHLELASAMSRTPERDHDLAFGPPYAQIEQAMVVRADATSATLSPDLAGRRIAVVTGWASDGAVRRLFPQAEPVPVASLADGLAALLDQRADLFIEVLPAIVETIERQRLHGLQIARPVLLGTGDLRLAGPPAEAARIEQLSAALDALGAPAREAALRRWTAASDLVTHRRTLNLSDAERAALARVPPLRLGVVTGQAPFSFALPGGAPQGLSVDMLAAMLQRLGLKTASTRSLSAAEALAELAADRIDLLIGLPEHALRQVPAATFVGPYIEHPLVIVGNRGLGAWGLEQLGGRRVATPLAQAPATALRARHPALNLVDCASVAECAALLERGGADALLTDAVSAAIVLARTPRPELQIVGAVPDLRRERGYGLAPARRALGPLLRRSLDVTLAADLPTLKRQWLEHPAPAQVSRRLLWQFGPWVAAALLLLLGGWWLHSRRLTAEMRRTEAARREAERRDAATTRFITFLAHEVRNSLHSVIAGAELLRSAKGATAGIAEALGSSSRATLGLLNTLLDRERLEAGRLTLQLGAARVGPLLAAVVEEMRPAAQAHGMTIGFAEATPLPALHVDALRVQQIVRNLLSNAIKHAGRGSVQVLARCEDDPAAATRSRLTVTVRDHGPGMDAAALDRAFEPFHVGSSASGEAASSGLGLGLSRDLAVLMGGSLTLRSAPGEGVEATLSFSAERSGAPGTVAPAPGSRSVLVVEDAEVYAMLLERALVQAGWRVTLAASVARAREALLLQPFDLVLSDLHLEDGGAPEVLAAVHLLDGQRARRPILAVMSAELDPQVDAVLRAQGAQLVVAKSADVPLFVQLLLEHPALAAAPAEALATTL